jgi:hypothetical protein
MGINWISAALNAYETIASFINTLVSIVRYVIIYGDVIASLFE